MRRAIATDGTTQQSWVEKLGAGHIILGVALVLYPLVASDFFLTQIGGYSLIFGMLGLSLMLLAAYGGMVSLAQITVAGISAYAIAILANNNST
ncbi:branched-chain amino acid ABC transporter permease, partial [Mesorhizobium sp. M00.F.Ca.ET.158.01.1.1]